MALDQITIAFLAVTAYLSAGFVLSLLGLRVLVRVKHGVPMFVFLWPVVLAGGVILAAVMGLFHILIFLADMLDMALNPKGQDRNER
jgi:hypothetical protein